MTSFFLAFLSCTRHQKSCTRQHFLCVSHVCHLCFTHPNSHDFTPLFHKSKNKENPWKHWVSKGFEVLWYSVLNYLFEFSVYRLYRVISLKIVYIVRFCFAKIEYRCRKFMLFHKMLHQICTKIFAPTQRKKTIKNSSVIFVSHCYLRI